MKPEIRTGMFTSFLNAWKHRRGYAWRGTGIGVYGVAPSLPSWQTGKAILRPAESRLEPRNRSFKYCKTLEKAS